jgi:phosphate starvation-inducible protein PhoH and related proteins
MYLSTKAVYFFIKANINIFVGSITPGQKESYMGAKRKVEKQPSYAKDVIKLTPRNIKQDEYIRRLLDFNQHIVIGTGPAGTGKTLLAVKAAVKAFKERKVDKIIVTRPVVENDEELGHLPGDLIEKMAPWIRPIRDVLLEHFPKSKIESMMYEEVLEIAPLAFMRGRTFKNAYIIGDEMQNTTDNQMKMFLTRIGEGSKMAITGDLAQADRGDNNGLNLFMNRLLRTPTAHISTVQFDKYDIERHPVVAEVLRVYN